MFGEKLNSLREKRGMSQVDLARILGKSKQSVSNWENNNIMPSIDMLIRLSEIFHVSCDFLLDLEDRKYIEVTGLEDEQIAHIQLVINDIRGDK